MILVYSWASVISSFAFSACYRMLLDYSYEAKSSCFAEFILVAASEVTFAIKRYCSICAAAYLSISYCKSSLTSCFSFLIFSTSYLANISAFFCSFIYCYASVISSFAFSTCYFMISFYSSKTLYFYLRSDSYNLRLSLDSKYSCSTAASLFNFSASLAFCL